MPKNYDNRLDLMRKKVRASLQFLLCRSEPEPQGPHPNDSVVRVAWELERAIQGRSHIRVHRDGQTHTRGKRTVTKSDR